MSRPVWQELGSHVINLTVIIDLNVINNEAQLHVSNSTILSVDGISSVALE